MNTSNNNNNVQKKSDESNNFLKLTDIDGVKYVDSRVVAVELGITHDHLIDLITTSRHIIEDQAGRILEKTDPEHSSAEKGIYYLLTESQQLCIDNFLPHNSISDDFIKKVVATFDNIRQKQPYDEGVTAVNTFLSKNLGLNFPVQIQPKTGEPSGNIQQNDNLQVKNPQVFNGIELIDLNGTKFIDSRILAEGLGIDHGNLMETIRKHQQTIEKHFGAVPFQTEPRKDGNLGGSQPKYALLNEGQALFIGSLSKNTPPVVLYKAQFAKAFLLARQAIKELTSINQEQLAFERDEIISSVIRQLPSVFAPYIEEHCNKVIDAFIGPIYSGKAELENKPAPKKEEKLLTEVQAANRLHMPLKSFLRLQNLGIGPNKTMSGKITMYRPCDIEAFDNAADEPVNVISQKNKRQIAIMRQIALCENIRGSAPSGTRVDLADNRRIRLLQEYFELIDGEKISQTRLLKQALDVFCEHKVFSAV